MPAREELFQACDLVEENPRLTPRDALHVATMWCHGIETIVSADTHFDSVEGIRRVDPALIEE